MLVKLLKATRMMVMLSIRFSGSKDATSLPLGTTPTTLPTTLQEKQTPDQSDASSSADLQPGNECKGGHGIREISKSCPQQQSPPGSQPSTLYDSPQPDEMPLPVRSWYVDENWVSLSRYADEKGKLDIETARDIVKEVINGMIYLKQYGIVHNDLNAGNVMYSPKTGQVKLIDFGMSDILPGWEEGKSVPLKSPDSSSTILGYKARDDERWSILVLRKLLYRIITPKDIELVHSNDEQAIRETIPYESDPYKRGLKKKAIRLIVTLNSPDPEQIPSTEAILNDPFFN
ncbi:hypothetical protein BASA84_001522 [Batrachochytrium salamandrivorans]|nr:hypothetical protein BASA84_001522 [Batrachochytrium salamandrivorans]